MPIDKKVLVLSYTTRPKLRELLDSIKAKTGMRNAGEIIMLALAKLDGSLPVQTASEQAKVE